MINKILMNKILIFILMLLFCSTIESSGWQGKTFKFGDKNLTIGDKWVVGLEESTLGGNRVIWVSRYIDTYATIGDSVIYVIVKIDRNEHDYNIIKKPGLFAERSND